MAEMIPTRKQITLVRNLLALSQSSYPAEADEAKKKAAQLSAKWGVTRAHLAPPAPPAPPKCPGCLGCQPMRAGVVVVKVQFTTSGTTGETSTFWSTYA